MKDLVLAPKSKIETNIYRQDLKALEALRAGKPEPNFNKKKRLAPPDEGKGMYDPVLAPKSKIEMKNYRQQVKALEALRAGEPEPKFKKKWVEPPDDGKGLPPAVIRKGTVEKRKNSYWGNGWDEQIKAERLEHKQKQAEKFHSKNKEKQLRSNMIQNKRRKYILDESKNRHHEMFMLTPHVDHKEVFKRSEQEEYDKARDLKTFKVSARKTVSKWGAEYDKMEGPLVSNHIQQSAIAIPPAAGARARRLSFHDKTELGKAVQKKPIDDKKHLVIDKKPVNQRPHREISPGSSAQPLARRGSWHGRVEDDGSGVLQRTRDPAKKKDDSAYYERLIHGLAIDLNYGSFDEAYLDIERSMKTGETIDVKQRSDDMWAKRWRDFDRDMIREGVDPAYFKSSF
ncbi:uncharacterized protein J4E87_003569 [Alternaria ethzedia]|uniref:uncharacterized protein n=1 Tax=Alternaria ethzedia TaxID=181014 RepID=UPI0020C2DBE4|nr:uncharacterized protein J4E87_003569 [Alternaria ethzedia]KAI4629305.1 hypothetical protein J4E87_003569 [Alternaria ethzedia]